jgi:hypothetical protein
VTELCDTTGGAYTIAYRVAEKAWYDLSEPW